MSSLGVLEVRSLYLAGPMRGYEDFNFPAFHEAAHDLRQRGFTVYSPAERDEKDPAIESNSELAEKGWDFEASTMPLWYFMQHDLAAVCRADAVMLLPRWTESYGARLEAIVAVQLHKQLFLYMGEDAVPEPIPYYHVRRIFMEKEGLCQCNCKG